MPDFDAETRALIARLKDDPKSYAKTLRTVSIEPSGDEYVVRGLNRLLKSFKLGQYILEGLAGVNIWWAANERPVSSDVAGSLVSGLSQLVGRKIEFGDLLAKQDHVEKAPRLLQSFQWWDGIIDDEMLEVEDINALENLIAVAVGLAEEVVIASRHTNVGSEFVERMQRYKRRISNPKGIAIADALLQSAESVAYRVVSQGSPLGCLLKKLAQTHDTIVNKIPGAKEAVAAAQDPTLERTPTPHQIDTRVARLIEAMQPFLAEQVADRLEGLKELGDGDSKNILGRPRLRRARLIIFADFVQALLQAAKRVPEVVAVADRWATALHELKEVWQYLSSFLPWH